MPENEAQHQLRVDAGTVYEVTIKDPEFGTFAVHELMPGGRGLIASLPSGGTLYYRWTLDQAIETFEFPLDGFSQLVRQAPERCP